MTAPEVALPELPGISDTPTDPACPGSRHGSMRAYRAHGCCCPEVVAYVIADAELRRARRAAERAAGIRHRPASEVDQGDVEAAVWAALRWHPVPDTLTQAERKAVVLRLRRAGAGWTGLMSAREIAARMEGVLVERTVERYLEEASAAAAAARAARRQRTELTAAA